VKGFKRNWLISIGMLVIAASLVAKNMTKLPDFIYGFGMGVGIGLELIGLYTANHDISKIKRFKRKYLKVFVK